MAVNVPLVVRRTHKWLALLVGIQAVMWAVSGLYMTVIDIDIIHGDHFIDVSEPRPIPVASLTDPAIVAAAVPGGRSLEFHWLLDRPTYIVTSTDEGRVLVDALTGARLPPPDEDQIRRLADLWFTGDERIEAVRLIDEVPGEIRGREPPVWRVDFEGWNQPTLYFDPATGKLLTRRHELWRVFDFFWMTHVMDYETRDNVNNRLLIVASWATLAMTLVGAWLLLYSFSRRKKRGARS